MKDTYKETWNEIKEGLGRLAQVFLGSVIVIGGVLFLAYIAYRIWIVNVPA